MFNRSVFSGDLDFMSLGDLLQILGSNESTGTLRINNPYASNPAKIYFVDGAPVNAICGSLYGMDAVYTLFGWTDGEFEFQEKNINVKRGINDSIMQIVLNSTRLVDEGVIKRVEAPSYDQDPMQYRGFKGPVRVIEGQSVDYQYILDEQRFPDGQAVVEEGKYGNWIWVIMEGVVRVTRETSKGPMNLCSLGQGCFIGNFSSFAHEDHARTATATAEGDVRLGMLDITALSREYAALSPDLREVLQSLAGRLKKITDMTVDVFTNKRHDSELIRDNGSLWKKVVPKKGGMFSIARGNIQVVGKTNENYLPLSTLEKNDVFGDLPFLGIGHEPYSAAVFASKDLRVKKLDTVKLEKEYTRLPDILRRLIHNVKTCISETTKLVYSMI
ncbi:MAG: DUF4388 domain-containing protein [Desulfobacterales bacterium]|nr:DUF4388 domain-containing protein [Desulfobacterales bacterium]